MPPGKRTKRICPQGHTYYKSTDCPTCPICSKLLKPTSGFLAELGGPARNTLMHAGIKTLKQLARYSEKEILGLHGMGPSSMPILKRLLKKAGLKFKAPPAK